MANLQNANWEEILRHQVQQTDRPLAARCKLAEPTTNATAMTLDDRMEMGSNTLPSPPASSASASPVDCMTCDGVETPTSSLELCDEAASFSEPPRLSNPLLTGLTVLNAEAAALSHLANVYATDEYAQTALEKAVQAIATGHPKGGKVVVVGVGKSGLIGNKVTRTLQSLGVPAISLHPTEALHGDMGIITRHDTLLFITYSGRTTELLSLLPHLDPSLPTILLTSHTRPDSCVFMEERYRPDAILLTAPVRAEEQEVEAFGVAAPTTSTTVALAVGDALAMAAAREVWGGEEAMRKVFARNHPGGAIGMGMGK